MTRHTLHVPQQYNDGSAVGQDVFDLIEADILNAAGGFTLTLGIGAWKSDDGKVYREPVRLYHADSDAANVADRLAFLARRVGIALRQEAVYLTASELDAQVISVPVPINN